MATLRSSLGALAFSLLAFLTTTNAFAGSPFSAERFEAAQAGGRTILVEVAASWCPVCQAQRPVIDKLTASDRFKDTVVLEVDFDAQKDVVKRFGARSQSTLIVFKGTREVDRSVGDTSEAGIRALLERGR